MFYLGSSSSSSSPSERSSSSSWESSSCCCCWCLLETEVMTEVVVPVPEEEGAPTEEVVEAAVAPSEGPMASSMSRLEFMAKENTLETPFEFDASFCLICGQCSVFSGHSASQLIAVKRIRGNNFFVLVGLQTRIGSCGHPTHPDTRTPGQRKMGEK